jgi:DNA-3-methyladenine glycosylase II
MSLTIRPVAPFDLSLCGAIFASGDPEIRTFREGVFSQVLRQGAVTVLVEVRSAGTVEDPVLSLTIQSEHPVTTRATKQIQAQVAMMLSADDDLAPFYGAVMDDPIMADLTRSLRGLKAPVTPTVFEALTDSIIEQQISLSAARSIQNRLIRMLGQQLAIDGTIHYAYPDPEILAGTPDTAFRSCGLSTRKGEYIRDIARMITNGNLDVEGFRKIPENEEVITDLVRIRGIGRWTAELTILRGLHRPEAFPADDVGVRRSISRFYLGGEKISSADARTFAERWGSWKGFAAYYLEVAGLLGIRPPA